MYCGKRIESHMSTKTLYLGPQMLEFSQELCLRFEVAMARVELQIELDACDALLKMGVTDDTILSNMDMNIMGLQIDLADLEEQVKDLEFQRRLMRESGCVPFDSDKWHFACQSALASSFPGVSSYKHVHETNIWFARCMSFVSDEAKHKATEIFLRCRSASYGMDPFDAASFRETCDQASKTAAHGCGLSDVLWLTRCTASIGSLLRCVPLARLAEAKEIARNAGWLDSTELRELSDYNEDEGLCSHGLDLECCPAGCGELDLEYGFP